MTANTHEKILEVRGLTKTYGGVKKKGAKQPTPTLDVLKGIDIDIYRGDVVCLIGPSGCGKSTFLRCLNRLEIPTSGSIKFEGVEVDDAHIDAVRQKMGMVFQHFNLFPHLTVKKNLELAPSLLKLKDKEAISQRADELLARVRTAIRHTRTATGNSEIAQQGTYTVGDLTIDYNKHQVLVRGENAKLTLSEFRIVALLGKHAGRVMTYDSIIKELWGPRASGDNQILRVNMANIRRKIEKNPAEPEYLFTEVGVGYRMAESEN